MCQSYHPSIGRKSEKRKPLKVASTFNLLRKHPVSVRKTAFTRKACRSAMAAQKRCVKFTTNPPTTHTIEHATTTPPTTLFYSSSDIQAMRDERKQTIQILHLRYELATRHPHLVNVGEAAAFEGCVLTGIENRLTPEIVAKSSRRRVGVVKAVLEEQARQRAAVVEGEKEEETTGAGIERLAEVAMVQSKGEAKRARKIGFHQSRI